MNRVSVIIPNWNGASFVGKAIESALKQGNQVAEVLVCDDGSTDESANVVAAYTDPRVKWLPGPHGGLPAKPRNRGIQVAQSEYLAFLDNDDVWLPGKLESQLERIKDRNISVVSSNAWRVVDGQRKGLLLPYNASEILTFRKLARENRVICSSALVRRNDVLRAGGFSEDLKFKAVEDYHLWLRMAELGNVFYEATPLIEYRDQPALSIRGRDNAASQRLFWVYKDYARSRVTKVQQWPKAAYIALLSTWRKLKTLQTKKF
ncbi:MAG: glycosyltransferase family 2 protein [Bdellovibrionia bacterium]